MTLPTLAQIEAFLSVAEYGSFTHAAKQLNLTKAAISHHIKTLEQQLGISLFIRTTRSIKLTDEGELLVKQCGKLKEELTNTQHLITNFHIEPSGTLRIICNPYLSKTYLLPALTTYLNEFPNMKVEVFGDERLPDFQREDIDIALAINWPAPDDVVAQEIGITRYVLCASPTYLQQHGKPKRLSDLKHHHYIPHSGRNAKTPLINLKTSHKIQLNSSLQINNAQMMKDCAVAGLGIVQLHDYMIETELTNKQLIELLPNEFQQTIPLYVYYNKHRFVQPKIRHFINYLIPKKIIKNP